MSILAVLPIDFLSLEVRMCLKSLVKALEIMIIKLLLAREQSF